MAAGLTGMRVSALLAGLLLLVACGGDDPSAAPATTVASDLGVALAPPGLDGGATISLPTAPPDTAPDGTGVSTPGSEPGPTVAPPPDDGDGNESNPANQATYEDLWGTWTAEGTHPQNGPVTAWFAFSDRGYEFTLSMPQIQYAFTMSGGLEFDPGAETLTLDIDDYAPREWCGPLGCSPIVLPAREYDRFEFKDADHVVITSVDCIETACEVLYTKTRDG